mgnify:CR=1 FL=1
MAEIETLMGVSATDIEKVMGVEAGDIEKVMGVELVTSIGYQGNRSLALGGYGPSASVEEIEYKALTSDSDTLDFGDATWAGSHDKRSCGSDSRAVFMGGHDAQSGSTAGTNNIEYLTIASTGNGTEFGDVLVAGVVLAGGSGNGVRGLFVGGRPSGNTDQIQYLTVATTGNTTDAGNLTRAAGYTIPNANVAPGRMICTMGLDSVGGSYDNQDFNYVAIMSTDDAADFGDASVAIAMAQTIGLSESRNVWAWGYSDGSHLVNMEYLNPSTLSDTTDFGDLQTTASNGAGKHTNGTRGEVWGGEASGLTDVQYITIASTGDATNAGEISTGTRRAWDGWSGD